MPPSGWGGGKKSSDVVDNVCLDGVEVGDDVWQRLVSIAQRIDQVPDREVGHLAIDVADFFPALFVPLRDLSNGGLEFLLEVLDRALDA